MKKLKFKIADYLVIGIILITGLAGFWFNIQEAGAAGRKYALIYVQNEQVAELSLTPGDSFNYELNFGDRNQHTAVIEIEDGRIRMLPMDEELCPRSICSHTGWISYSYESIVCLPNQIMVAFSETPISEAENGIDGVTY